MVDAPAPADPAKFFPWLKLASERLWATAAVNPSTYGFQIQPGTRWRPGLTAEQLGGYEADLGFRFPDSYRRFLEHMNGTTPAAVNVYGGCGKAYAYGPAYYSYPDDLEAVRARIEWIYKSFGLTADRVERQDIPHIIPVTGHRFLVADRCECNPVLSMHGSDVILYASSLEAFLVNDIFGQHKQEPGMRSLTVGFWLE